MTTVAAREQTALPVPEAASTVLIGAAAGGLLPWAVWLVTAGALMAYANLTWLIFPLVIPVVIGGWILCVLALRAAVTKTLEFATVPYARDVANLALLAGFVVVALLLFGIPAQHFAEGWVGRCVAVSVAGALVCGLATVLLGRLPRALSMAVAVSVQVVAASLFAYSS